MASIHDDWLSEKAHLMQAEYNYKFVCPECGKDGFSVQKTGNKLLYHCFKAGCGFSGRVLLTGHSSLASQAQAVPQEDRLTPYTGPLQFLEPDEISALALRFQISEATIRQHIDKSIAFYVLPILSHTGGLRGRVRRVPWTGVAPNSIARVNEGVPKSQIFKEKHEPMISWYFPAGNSVHTYTVSPAILVEDQMSAIKLADCGYTACALLGTSLNSEKISEIQSVSKHIVIALDSDATATAFKLARKWQSAFSSCRVVILERDCKDMSREELNEKFG